MADTPAMGRLRGGHYNTADWNATTNPGGMGGDGHRYALIPPKPPQTGAYPVMVNDLVAVLDEAAAATIDAQAQVGLAAAEADRARMQADRATSLVGTSIAGSLSQSLTLPLTAGAVLSLTGLSTGKAWVPGHQVELLPGSAPLSGQRIQGTLTAYNPTTGAASLTVKRSWGTGTVTQWSVRCVAPSPFSTGHVNRSLADLSADGTHVRADGRAVEKTDAPALYDLIGDRYAGTLSPVAVGPFLGNTITALPNGGPVFFQGGFYYLFAQSVIWRGTSLSTLAPFARVTQQMQDVAHNGAGLFVMILGNNQVACLDNGVLTETTTSPFAWASSGTMHRIVWSPTQSRFYAFGNIAAAGWGRSADGRTWTFMSVPSNYNYCEQVVWHAGRMVMVQNSATYLVSADGGENWTSHSDLPYAVSSVAAKGDDASGNSWVMGSSSGIISVANQFTGSRSVTNLATSSNNNLAPYNAILWDSLSGRFAFVAGNDDTKICWSASFPISTAMTVVTRPANSYGYQRGRLLIVNGLRLDYTANMISSLDASYAATPAFVGYGGTTNIVRAAGKLYLFQSGWTVRVSSDNGETWTLLRAPIGYIDSSYSSRGAVSADGQKIMLVGTTWGTSGVYDTQTVIWSSTNGGSTWTRSLLGNTGTYEVTQGTLGCDNGYFHIHAVTANSNNSRIYWIAEATPSGTWSNAVQPGSYAGILTYIAGKWLLLPNGSSQVYISTAVTPTGFTAAPQFTENQNATSSELLYVLGNRVFVRLSYGQSYYRVLDLGTMTATTLWIASSGITGPQTWYNAIQVGDFLHVRVDSNLPGLSRATARVNLTTLAVVETLAPTTASGSVGATPTNAVLIGSTWYYPTGDRLSRLSGPTSTQFLVPNLDTQLGYFPAHYIAL
ncbi:hypothetical protein IP70_18750 [alpha proteobacterium AAP38]|uniref:hypothetical protein n=1 Tax=Niveispirillum sp. TaxID=1917217 RepID=UPI0006B96CFA|nr:hypothetical protein IP70_18750 [alpha proteobacterium AAP38]